MLQLTSVSLPASLSEALAVNTKVPTGWFSGTVSVNRNRAGNVGLNSLTSRTEMKTSQWSTWTGLGPPSDALNTRLNNRHQRVVR